MEQDYSTGKIYKIVSDCTTDVYIGSTIFSLKTRFTRHKCNYRLFLKNMYANVTVFKILKHEDCKIELLESFPCTTKQELFARESHYIRTLPNLVNSVIPDRTAQEYYMDNRKRISDSKKIYYQQNKEFIKKKNKKYQHDKKLISKNAAEQSITHPIVEPNAVSIPIAITHDETTITFHD